MLRPSPLRAFHFTHVDHLPSIARDGLVCDTDAHVPGRLTTEVGNLGVKGQRRRREVDVGPGGVVADYVPFYFTARNLMLYQIQTGRVDTYRRGQNGLIFLCTTLEAVTERGLSWVVSDRNASTSLARFTSNVADLDRHVDWPLASTPTFDRTPEDSERPQRHQAELLVHRAVPWDAVMFIGSRDADDLARVDAVLGTLKGYRPGRGVRPGWYF